MILVMSVTMVLMLVMTARMVRMLVMTVNVVPMPVMSVNMARRIKIHNKLQNHITAHNKHQHHINNQTKQQHHKHYDHVDSHEQHDQLIATRTILTAANRVQQCQGAQPAEAARTNQRRPTESNSARVHNQMVYLPSSTIGPNLRYKLKRQTNTTMTKRSNNKSQQHKNKQHIG